MKQPELPGLGRLKPPTPEPRPGGMPDWLRRQIETENPNAFGKTARWKHCGRCGTWTLEGWDAYDDFAGLAKIDPRALDADGELHAILDGKTTYTLEIQSNPAGSQKTLHRRTQFEIQAHPAPHDPGTAPNRHVVPAHRCDAAPLGRQLTPKELNP